jgi:hypothetical protein
METRKIHNITVGIYSLYIIFIHNIIPTNLQNISSTVSALLGIFLILGSIYFSLFDSESNRLKAFHQLTSKDNVGNYLQLWFLLYITYLDALNPFGPALYLTLAVTISIYCLYIIARVILKKEVEVTKIVIGHLVFLYLIYSCGIGTYRKYYGEETIGSFLEKSEYKVKYLVKLYDEDNDDKYYTLPAQLHIFSETIEEDYGDEYFINTEKAIRLETIYFNNGGRLSFNNCNLKKKDKVYGIDTNGKGWYIELTQEKIK